MLKKARNENESQPGTIPGRSLCPNGREKIETARSCVAPEYKASMGRTIKAMPAAMTASGHKAAAVTMPGAVIASGQNDCCRDNAWCSNCNRCSLKPPGLTGGIHAGQEVLIGLGRSHLVQQQFHGLCGGHGTQSFS